MQLFDRLEKKSQVQVPISVIVHIIVTQDQQNTEETTKEETKEIIFEFPLKSSDTVMTIQQRLQVWNISFFNIFLFLSPYSQDNLRKLTVDSKEERPEKDSRFSGDFSLLPKVQTFIGNIYEAAGLPRVDISSDASLLNFPLQDNIIIYFHV